MATSKHKCRNCKQYYPWLHEYPPFRVWCSDECAAALAMKRLPGQLKKKEKEEKQKYARDKRAFYDKDIKTRREAAVYWFNRFIRLRDADDPCISCGNRNARIKYDAGHYISAGSCTALRFDERNVNLQCSNHCNVHLSGNGTGYRLGLIKKYGGQVVDELEGPQPTIKISAAWYRSIEEKYKAKCKELE